MAWADWRPARHSGAPQSPVTPSLKRLTSAHPRFVRGEESGIVPSLIEGELEADFTDLGR
jgi:hypothetical protein